MEKIKINFIFNKQIICDRNNEIKDIIKKYCSETNQKKERLNFLYENKKINENLKIEEINDSDNEITILVKENNIINNANSLQYSENIICPICKNYICIINFEDYKISLNKCNSGRNHDKKDIFLKEYQLSSSRKEKKICQSCRKERNNLNDNKFYNCLTCKMNLCSSCKTEHDEKHIVTDYELINYKCQIHGNSFISFCEDCNKNLCKLCEKTHKNQKHKIIDYRKILTNQNIRESFNEFSGKLSEFLNIIQSMREIIDDVIYCMNIYFRINEIIMNNYEKENKNYQTLKNVKNITEFNKIVRKDIEQIINQKDIGARMKFVNKIYLKISNPSKKIIQFRYSLDIKSSLKNPKNVKFRNSLSKPNLPTIKTINENQEYNFTESNKDITLQYKVEQENGNLKILGKEFVKRNKMNCKLLINNKIHELS